VHVDDRVVVGAWGLLGPHGRDPVDPVARTLVVTLPFAVAAHRLALALQRWAVTELGVEQDYQVGTQRGQFGA
jgi:hypothetical protein